MPRATIINSDALEALRRMPDANFSAALTDPPYGLTDRLDVEAMLRGWLEAGEYDGGRPGLMSMAWDASVPPPAFWREVCRVLKPGGHVAAFAAARNVDLAMLAMRLGGLEVVTTLAALRGTGWPKCGDIGKMIDKAAGATREVVGLAPSGGGRKLTSWTSSDASEARSYDERKATKVTRPATELAKRFDDYSGELKPAQEPIIVCRKPFKGTYAEAAAAHGVAGLNIGGCRIVVEGQDKRRYPPNVVVVHDHECTGDACAPGCPVTHLDAQAGTRSSGRGKVTRRAGEERNVFGTTAEDVTTSLFGDSGSAARFYYCARAAPSERHKGCAGLHWVVDRGRCYLVSDLLLPTAERMAAARKVKLVEGCPHPTLKPIELTTWLAKLVRPPAGGDPRRLLVPFSGSGSEVVGGLLSGWDEVIGVEQDPSFAFVSRRRIVGHGFVPDPAPDGERPLSWQDHLLGD